MTRLQADLNGILFPMSSRQKIVTTTIHVLSDIENHMNRIVRAFKSLFKDILVLPRPKMATHYHEDRFPVLLRLIILSVIWLDLTIQSKIRITWTQSLNVWMALSSLFSQMEQMSETPTPHPLHRTLWLKDYHQSLNTLPHPKYSSSPPLFFTCCMFLWCKS